MTTKEIFSTSPYWQINKDLAKKVGIEAALLLTELGEKQVYYQQSDSLKYNDGTGYFFATSEQIQLSTGLGYRAQKNAIIELEKHNMLKSKRMGSPAKLYFSIYNSSILDLLNSQFLNSQNDNSSISETRNQVLAKRENIIKNIDIKTIESITNLSKENSGENAASLDIEEESSMFENENPADYQTKPENIQVEAKKEKPPVAPPPPTNKLLPDSTHFVPLKKMAIPTEQDYTNKGWAMPKEKKGDGRLQWLCSAWWWEKATPEHKEKYLPYTQEFINYWTLPDQNKGVELWTLQKTFDIGLRLAKWLQNQSKFNSNNKSNESNKRNIGTVESGKPADSIANADYSDFERMGCKVIS